MSENRWEKSNSLTIWVLFTQQFFIFIFLQVHNKLVCQEYSSFNVYDFLMYDFFIFDTFDVPKIKNMTTSIVMYLIVRHDKLGARDNTKGKT